MLVEGKTYTISRCQLKPANQQYNTCKNDYELSGDQNTVIELCQENIKVEMNYDFKTVASLSESGAGGACDLIGVITEAKDIRSVNTKKGDVVAVRDITLVDDSNASVSCSLWGKSAETNISPNVWLY